MDMDADRTMWRTMRRNRPLIAAAMLSSIAFISVSPAGAQHAGSKTADATAKEVAELRAKVDRLEAALKGRAMPGKGKMNTAKGGKMSGMGAGPAAGGMPMGNMMAMMDDMMAEHPMGSASSMMGSSPKMPVGGMGMGMGAMGCCSMMSMPSSLPGFPGASHIYHVGGSGFFLDQPAMLGLTAEQQQALNAVKEKALLAQQDAERKVTGLEQELWQLTASDTPDQSKIESKVREIEKLKGDSRVAFIRSVGEAAKLLTDQQRKMVVGQAPMMAPSAAMAPGMPMSDPGMMMDDSMEMGGMGGSMPSNAGGGMPAGGMGDM